MLLSLLKPSLPLGYLPHMQRTIKTNICQTFSSCTNLLSSVSATSAIESLTVTIRGRRTKSSETRTQSTLLDLIQSIPVQYLRAIDPSKYNNDTGQRTDVQFDVTNGKKLPVATQQQQHLPAIEHIQYNEHSDICEILWQDGHNSIYTLDILRNARKEVETSNQPQEFQILTSKNNKNNNQKFHEDDSGIVYWTGLDEHSVRTSNEVCLPFEEVIYNDNAPSLALQALHKYGILLVTDTIVDDNGGAVAALASCFSGGSIKSIHSSILSNYRSTTTTSHHSTTKDHGNVVALPFGTDGPMRTLYGTVWSTNMTVQSDGASVSDSAYGTGALPLHTDLTYYNDPPGLQIFTMKQPSICGGGESIICDGFAAAHRLRTTNPQAFNILSTMIRNYQCIDKQTGWHLHARGPIISLSNNNEQFQRIRHNDLDRLPDLPPVKNNNRSSHDTEFFQKDELDQFYSSLHIAHELWDQIISDDDIRLVLSLQKGDTIIVSNQRCMHGRFSFWNSPNCQRSIIGCYVSQDELNSRYRMEGLVPYSY